MILTVKQPQDKSPQYRNADGTKKPIKYQHDLSKIDYSSKTALMKSLRLVFPECNEKQIMYRYDIEREFIGWEKAWNAKLKIYEWVNTNGNNT